MSTNCGCDLNAPCEDPECVTEREAEAARYYELFRAGALRTSPTPQECQDIRDAGRGHLLREDQQ